MKLVLNFQLVHTQTVCATYKYVPVRTHLIPKSLQARSAGTSAHKWFNWQAWNPFGAQVLPSRADKWTMMLTNSWLTCLWETVCANGVELFGRNQCHSLEIHHGRLQSKIRRGEVRAGNIQITNSSWYFLNAEDVTTYGWHFACTEEMGAHNEVALSFLLPFI